MIARVRITRVGLALIGAIGSDGSYPATLAEAAQRGVCEVYFLPFPEGDARVRFKLRDKIVERKTYPMPLHRNLTKSLKSYNNPYQGPRRLRSETACLALCALLSAAGFPRPEGGVEQRERN
jgi:hypothetical protein